MFKTKEEKAAAINAALDFVHTDMKVLAENVAAEHALVNMGMSVEDFCTYADPNRLQNFLYGAFNSFYQQSESDEMARGTMREYNSWVKQAKKDIALVKQAGLPLTARNVRDCFMHQGAFAGTKKPAPKKAAKKRK